jgi:hypothetical protein
MPATTIRIGEALSYGWRTFIERPLFWIGLMVIYFGLQQVAKAIGEQVQAAFDREPMTALLILVIPAIVYGLVLTRLMLGLFSISLATVDGGRPGFRDLLANGSRFWRFLGANIVFVVAVLVGLLLLVVPGLYLWARDGFYPYAIIDKNAGPIESLRTSSRLTEGVRWPLVLCKRDAAPLCGEA